MIKDLIKYVFIAVLLSVVALLFSIAVGHVFHLEKYDRYAIEDVVYVLLLVPIFLKLRYIDLRDIVSAGRFSWGVFIVALICIFAMSSAIDLLASLLHISKDSQSQMENDILCHPFALFTVTVIAPIAEEVEFRGALLRRMLQSPKLSPWVAIGCSAVFFSVGHVFSVMIVNALLVGLLFGWLYYKTRNLLLTISLHMANNTIYSLILFSSLKDFQFAQTYSWQVVALAVLLLVALSAICLRLLYVLFHHVSKSDISCSETT